MNYKKRFDRDHRILHRGELQRRDGRYEYKWTDFFGRRHSVYAKDLDTLRIKEEKLELDRLEGIKVPPSRLTIEDLYETWIKLKRGIRPSTRSNYIYTFDSLIRPIIGKKLVTKIKRSDVKAYYVLLLEERGISIGTVDNVHTILHQIFQFAVDDDYLRKNPTDHALKEIKLSYNLKGMKRNALSLRHEVNFLDYLFNNDQYFRWYPTFFIMANTGLRVGELTGLRWCDIDLDKMIIDVNHGLVYYNHRDGTGCGFSIHSPKTNNGTRLIPMTQAVKEAFLMEKVYQETIGIKSLDEIDGYKDFIFINYRGHVQNQHMLNRALHSIIRSYNSRKPHMNKLVPVDILPEFSCHVLRHTFATRMFEAGASAKYVQSIMGHSEVQTTLDIYVDVSYELTVTQFKPFETYMNTAFGQAAGKTDKTINIIS